MAETDVSRCDTRLTGNHILVDCPRFDPLPLRVLFPFTYDSALTLLYFHSWIFPDFWMCPYPLSPPDALLTDMQIDAPSPLVIN